MSISTGRAEKTVLEDTDAFAGKDSSFFFSSLVRIKEYLKTAMFGSSSTGWTDYLMPFSAAKGNGTTEPVWADTGNGLYAYKFTPGDELMTTCHVNHDWAQGTLGYVHMHWFVDSTLTAGQQFTWRVNWMCARGHSQGDSMTAATTTFDMVYTATGTEVAGEHIITECSLAQAMDLQEPDTINKFKFELLSENVTGNIFAEQADLHVEIDRIGTKNKSPNFYN